MNAVEWQSNDLLHLGQELQKKLDQVHQRFDAQINQAMNFDERERLRARMNDLIENIQASFSEQVDRLSKDPDGSPLYDGELAGIDMTSLVYDGDRRSLATLVSDAEFSGRVNKLLAEQPPYNARKDLLTRALKLTPRMAPVVHEVLNRCRETLDLRQPVEVYVYQDSNFNAACFPPTKDHVLLMLTSSLLEKFGARELAFVMGHEIGHYLFEHTRYPVNYILSHGDGYISPLQAMKLFAWVRNAEVTADRVGLVCCQDFQTAASTFFKLSSGLTSEVLDFHLEDYLDQLDDLQFEMSLAEEEDPADWFSSHPFSPLRIKALQLFAHSALYHKLIGREGGRLTREVLETQIASLMSVMEPNYLKDSTNLGKTAQAYVLNAGYLVAAANGIVEPSEVQALAQILGPRVSPSAIRELSDKPIQQVQDDVVAISKEVNQLMAPTQKLQLISDMVVISYADGSVDEYEMRCLYWLTEQLGIDPAFVDHVLSSALRGVD